MRADADVLLMRQTRQDQGEAGGEAAGEGETKPMVLLGTGFCREEACESCENTFVRAEQPCRCRAAPPAARCMPFWLLAVGTARPVTCMGATRGCKT